MNFDFAKPNLDDKVLKYVSMAEYKDNTLTDLDIEKIVEILKDRKIF